VPCRLPIVHIPRTTTLWVAILTNVVALVAIPLWAKLPDRIGRKPVFIVRTPVPSVVMFAYLGDQPSQCRPNLPVRYPDLWRGLQRLERHLAVLLRRDVRYPRAAIGHGHPTQIGFALAGFAPAIAAAVQRTGPTSWVPVAVLTPAACAVASAAAWTARETYDVPMRDLGR
jgi:MFS family permease